MEIRQRQDAFALESDIEDYGVGGDGDHDAFELFAAVFILVIAIARVTLLVLREQVAERLGVIGGLRFSNAAVGKRWIGHERTAASSRTNPN